MKIKTNELNGDALDWAVSYCVEWSNKFPIMPFKVLPYSSHWAQGGQIIEREKISIEYMAGAGDAGADVWVANMTYPDKKFGGVAFSEEQGSTPLTAAMRCYVASKLGDEVEVPDELLEGASE